MKEQQEDKKEPRFYHFLPAITVLCLIFFGLIIF